MYWLTISMQYICCIYNITVVIIIFNHLYSDTRLEIDLQSIAECSDFIEIPTNGMAYPIPQPLLYVTLL